MTPWHAQDWGSASILVTSQQPSISSHMVCFWHDSEGWGGRTMLWWFSSFLQSLLVVVGGRSQVWGPCFVGGSQDSTPFSFLFNIHMKALGEVSIGCGIISMLMMPVVHLLPVLTKWYGQGPFPMPGGYKSWMGRRGVSSILARQILCGF